MRRVCPAGTAGGHDTIPKMLCNVIPYKTTLKVSFSMFPEKFLFAAGACVLLRKIVMFIAGYAWWLIPLKYQLSLWFPVVVI